MRCHPSSSQVTARARRRGFTVLEVSITTVLLVIVFGSLALGIQGMQGLAVSSNERGALQTAGQDALLEVLGDLRRSGTVEVGGFAYPLVFEGGDPGEGHPQHLHTPATKSGEPGDLDFGPDRAILYVLPRDEDGDRRPDVDENGELIWDEDVHGFVLITGADGVNRLERWVEDRPPRVVARHVERIVFDDAASAGFQIPLGSVRVRLFLRKVDSSGRIQRFTTEGVVALRNG